MNRFSSLIPTLLATAVLLSPATASAFDHSHAALSAVLRQVVSDERVDYAALQQDPAKLRDYLDTLASVSRKEYQSWNENQQLAFLINLYNAATLQLIIDHYPVKSIKNIGNLLKGPWDRPVVDLFGEKVTLNHIEHGIIRKDFDEPRAHFGLVCASIGCPPLRAEAFTPDRLAAQLDEQGRIFFASPSKNRIDRPSGTLYLSPIFKWFRDDFVRNGSLESFVAPYFANAADREAVRSGKLAIKYTGYDWSLNRS